MSKPKPKKPKKLEATKEKKKSKAPSTDDLASPDLDRQTSADLWGEGGEDPTKEGDEGWDDDGGEGGGDEWGDLNETAETTSKAVVVAKTPYRVLDSKTVSSRRDKFISENADLLGLSIEEMDLLLRYLRYDDHKIDRFVNDAKTKAETRLQSGIRGEAKRPKPLTTKTVDCAAWCSTVPLSEAHALNCGHHLCNDCWKGFLKSEVNAGIVTVFSKCPGQDDKGKKCQEPVDYATMKKYLEPVDLAKLDRWILDHFVDCSPVLKWCPKAGCGFAIEYDGGDACDVFCKCSTSFCFHCLNPAHSPSPCDLAKKWISLTNDEEAASERLIQSLTKPCPKCNTRIEKNRQCNHMKCTKCSFDFCWQCMQAIVIGATHPSWYVCKNREKAQAEGKLDKMEEDRLKLTEFLTKFAWHKSRTEDCRKHSKASGALLLKISVAEGKMSDGRTLNWLTVIVKGIAEAHRFLEWSYVYSYFMEDNARKETFVNWQKILEEKADGMLKELEKALSDLDNFPKYLTTENKKITEIKKSTEVLTQKMKQMGELADEVSASLRHEADVKTTVWSCTRCSKESPDTAKDSTTKVIVCGSCGACRAHGDLDCLVLTCKKTT